MLFVNVFFLYPSWSQRVSHTLFYFYRIMPLENQIIILFHCAGQLSAKHPLSKVTGKKVFPATLKHKEAQLHTASAYQWGEVV